MSRDLSDFRRSYQKQTLLESDCPNDPMQLFQQWFDEAVATIAGEPNILHLSTLGIDGFPRSRVVLLKFFSAQGFVFYTNYESDKGKAMERHEKVGLSFFWEELQRQVHIKGVASRVDEATSDVYFNSRPRGSQLGAMASRQSTVISSRQVIDDKCAQLTQKYQGKDLVRPAHWGGYLVVPKQVEFWQGRSNRLHDRIRYELLAENKWQMNRLSP